MAGEEHVAVERGEGFAGARSFSSTKNVAAIAGYAASERNCSS